MSNPHPASASGPIHYRAADPMDSPSPTGIYGTEPAMATQIPVQNGMHPNNLQQTIPGQGFRANYVIPVQQQAPIVIPPTASEQIPSLFSTGLARQNSGVGRQLTAQEILHAQMAQAQAQANMRQQAAAQVDLQRRIAAREQAHQQMVARSNLEQQLVAQANLQQQIAAQAEAQRQINAQANMQRQMAAQASLQRQMAAQARAQRPLHVGADVQRQISEQEIIAKQIAAQAKLQQQMLSQANMYQQMAPPTGMYHQMVPQSSIYQQMPPQAGLYQQMAPKVELSQEMVPQASVPMQIVSQANMHYPMPAQAKASQHIPFHPQVNLSTSQFMPSSSNPIQPVTIMPVTKKQPKNKQGYPEPFHNESPQDSNYLTSSLKSQSPSLMAPSGNRPPLPKQRARTSRGAFKGNANNNTPPAPSPRPRGRPRKKKQMTHSQECIHARVQAAGKAAMKASAQASAMTAVKTTAVAESREIPQATEQVLGISEVQVQSQAHPQAVSQPHMQIKAEKLQANGRGQMPQSCRQGCCNKGSQSSQAVLSVPLSSREQAPQTAVPMKQSSPDAMSTRCCQVIPFTQPPQGPPISAAHCSNNPQVPLYQPVSSVSQSPQVASFVQLSQVAPVKLSSQVAANAQVLQTSALMYAQQVPPLSQTPQTASLKSASKGNPATQPQLVTENCAKGPGNDKLLQQVQAAAPRAKLRRTRSKANQATGKNMFNAPQNTGQLGNGAPLLPVTEMSDPANLIIYWPRIPHIDNTHTDNYSRQVARMRHAYYGIVPQQWQLTNPEHETMNAAQAKREKAQQMGSGVLVPTASSEQVIKGTKTPPLGPPGSRGPLSVGGAWNGISAVRAAEAAQAFTAAQKEVTKNKQLSPSSLGPGITPVEVSSLGQGSNPFPPGFAEESRDSRPITTASKSQIGPIAPGTGSKRPREELVDPRFQPLNQNVVLPIATASTLKARIRPTSRARVENPVPFVALDPGLSRVAAPLQQALSSLPAFRSSSGKVADLSHDPTSIFSQPHSSSGSLSQESQINFIPGSHVGPGVAQKSDCDSSSDGTSSRIQDAIASVPAPFQFSQDILSEPLRPQNTSSYSSSQHSTSENPAATPFLTPVQAAALDAGSGYVDENIAEGPTLKSSNVTTLYFPDTPEAALFALINAEAHKKPHAQQNVTVSPTGGNLAGIHEVSPDTQAAEPFDSGPSSLFGLALSTDERFENAEGQAPECSTQTSNLPAMEGLTSIEIPPSLRGSSIQSPMNSSELADTLPGHRTQPNSQFRGDITANLDMEAFPPSSLPEEIDMDFLNDPALQLLLGEERSPQAPVVTFADDQAGSQEHRDTNILSMEEISVPVDLANKYLETTSPHDSASHAQQSEDIPPDLSAVPDLQGPMFSVEFDITQNFNDQTDPAKLSTSTPSISNSEIQPSGATAMLAANLSSADPETNNFSTHSVDQYMSTPSAIHTEEIQLVPASSANIQKGQAGEPVQGARNSTSLRAEFAPSMDNILVRSSSSTVVHSADFASSETQAHFNHHTIPGHFLAPSVSHRTRSSTHGALRNAPAAVQGKRASQRLKKIRRNGSKDNTAMVQPFCGSIVPVQSTMVPQISPLQFEGTLNAYKAARPSRIQFMPSFAAVFGDRKFVNHVSCSNMDTISVLGTPGNLQVPCLASDYQFPSSRKALIGSGIDMYAEFPPWSCAPLDPILSAILDAQPRLPGTTARTKILKTDSMNTMRVRLPSHILIVPLTPQNEYQASPDRKIGNGYGSSIWIERDAAFVTRNVNIREEAAIANNIDIFDTESQVFEQESEKSHGNSRKNNVDSKPI